MGYTNIKYNVETSVKDKKILMGMEKMTQEQKVTRGAVVILILSIVLLLCLVATTTLAYFAGSQKSNTTLVMGGPVKISMVDKDLQETTGQGQLKMTIKSDKGKQYLLPGMGIDMQAIAKITSSDENGTPALLRARLDISVWGIQEPDENRRKLLEKNVEKQIRDAMSECLNPRIDGLSDGWVLYEGDYYYCSGYRTTDGLGNEYITLQPIKSDATGTPITFINGTFQFPYKSYTNDYSNIGIEFNLTFQAIQDRLFDKNDKLLINTIPNVKSVMDEVDFDFASNIIPETNF